MFTKYYKTILEKYLFNLMIKIERKLGGLIILMSVFFVFLIQYLLIYLYINKMFQFTAIDIKEQVLNNEIQQFKFYMFQNLFFLILQSMGMFLCLNIGFLYLRIKVNFKEILNLIVISFLGSIIYQFLIIALVKLYNWTFTTNSLKTMSEKLNLENYISNEKTAPWIKLSLTSINLEQLLIFIILVIGIHKLMNINYNKSFIITAKTYGISILLWFVFAMVMEMNFS